MLGTADAHQRGAKDASRSSCRRHHPRRLRRVGDRGDGLGRPDGRLAETERFQVIASARILADDRTRFLSPDETEIGWIVRTGHVPLGYLDDEGATKATFPVADGQRVAVAGDRAQYTDNGEVVLLGRDSLVVNTGGEKVFVEEVEDVLKRHDAVVDVLVTGRPDDRFGQAVVAVVQLTSPDAASPGDLRAWCGDHLARYKAPRAVVFVDEVRRHPSGKADYRWAKEQAATGSTPSATEYPALLLPTVGTNLHRFCDGAGGGRPVDADSLQNLPDRARGRAAIDRQGRMARMDGNLLIRGGDLVDGTGAPSRRADVRVHDGLIAEVGTDLAPDGELVVDAGGAYVAPGLIESHTHFDAAVWWDPDCDPMPAHGCTTLVMANCGLGLAPLAPPTATPSSNCSRSSRTSPPTRSGSRSRGRGRPTGSTAPSRPGTALRSTPSGSSPTSSCAPG